MKTLCRLSLIVCTAFLTGCFGGPGAATPPPVPSGPQVVRDVMRVGDKITIRLTGVPDDGYIIEVQIPDSGQITVNLLSQPFTAAGVAPSDLAAEITNAYKTQRIYTSPVVEVIPEDRYVNVNGDVRSPARVVYTADMTLLSAIASCGGFDEYADRRHVRITRGQQVIMVNATLAAQTPGADPPLYPGDQINVPRTPF